MSLKTCADVTGWLSNRWTDEAHLLGGPSPDLCERHRQRKIGTSYYKDRDMAIFPEALFAIFHKNMVRQRAVLAPIRGRKVCSPGNGVIILDPPEDSTFGGRQLGNGKV